MKKIQRFIKPKPNWNGMISWQKLHSQEVLVCCDCGLAHTFFFRKGNDNKLKWRAKRNKEATKEARKRYHRPI